MENKLTGIYHNGTVRVEKYPEPIPGDPPYQPFYKPYGMEDAEYRHLCHNAEMELIIWQEEYNTAMDEWQAYESANIAEADKPYWEIEVLILNNELKYSPDTLQSLIDHWDSYKPYLVQKHGSVKGWIESLTKQSIPNGTEVTIDRIENNKAVIV